MHQITVSTFVRVLVHRLNRVAGDHNASNNLPLRSVLKKLVTSLELAAGVIDEAEIKGRDSQSVRLWLLHIRDVLFEVSGVIDEVQSEVQAGAVSFSFCRLNLFSKESKLVQALKLLCTSLGHEVNNMSKFMLTSYPNLFSVSPNLFSVSRGTISRPYSYFRPEIHGRDREAMKIKDEIFNHVAAADSILVVGIVGMGSIGKTSLAQFIYNDPGIHSKFEIKLWVTVGQRDDHIMPYVHQMKMQAMEQNHLNLDEDLKSSEQSRVELCELLAEKRFFLVLDDVWSISLFEMFLSEVLNLGSKGSVIIVTTRSVDVARMFSASSVHQLNPLPEDVCYHLFTEYASSSNVFRIKPEFDAIARRIVYRCMGYPLFLKMVGIYLRNKDTMDDWAEVSEKLAGQGFHPVLKFLCDKLPSYLKLPFCTLSLQEVFSPEELIGLWMALGFLYSDDPDQQPEDIGRMYLRELGAFALCPDAEYAPGGVVTDFKLHDIVNDLATVIACEQGFLRLRHDTNLSIDSSTKYIILEGDFPAEVDLLVILRSANQLWLFMLRPENQAPAQHLLIYVLSGFKSLRVLGLGRCGIEILPDSIGQLKHLRYLDVAENELLNTIPDSVCNLWHLQTLLLHGCHRFKELPASIGKLENLRYLTLTTSQETLQEEIGQLTSLRTLGLSSCQRLVSLPCSLRNLKKLQTLGIVDCPKMDLLASSSVEALKGIDDIDTMLLSGLSEFEHLPPNLGTPSVVMKHLSIQFSRKLKETAWINQFLLLQSLTIEECPELSTLMADGTSQFSNMAELVIRGCPLLDDTKWVRQFPSLQSLIIEGCPNLVALDPGFTELKKLEWLEIRRCPVLIKRIQILGGPDSSYISHVRLVELDGFPLPKPSESECSTQEDDANHSSIMDVTSSSNHVVSNSLSASEISENAS